MAPEVEAPGPLTELPPGPLLTLSHGAVSIDVAPQAGGRIAQIRVDGIEQLVGYGEYGSEAAIAWGSYTMVPWCGRVRDGRFAFAGKDYQLPRNLGGHAIHGWGFVLPWEVAAQSEHELELVLELPADERWPFGGRARQRIALEPRGLLLEMSVTAGERAMPVVFGWHPWFRKPERLEFEPTAMYPRDQSHVATLPLVPPGPGPWDDCFVNTAPVVLHRAGQVLRLTSDCDHWVVYDGTAHSTCVEPQTGPADAFNLGSPQLQPGQQASAWYRMAWD